MPDPLAHHRADGAGLQAMLSMAPVSVDELARQTGRPLGEIQAELLELELQGEIAVTAGGLVQRNADG